MMTKAKSKYLADVILKYRAGPGAKVKAAYLEIGGFKPHSDLQDLKKQNVSSPLTRKYSILLGASVAEM